MGTVSHPVERGSLMDGVPLVISLLMAANFDPARPDHWLLLLSAIALAAWGLWQSWQWQKGHHRR